MKIVNERNFGKEFEVQFELSNDEYEMLYEQYLKEKELKDDSDNYSFDDYFQELFDVILLQNKCDMKKAELDKKKQELMELKRILEFEKNEIQAKIDGNNS